MNLFHDLLTSNNMTLVTSVVVTDTTDYKSIISRLLVSLALFLSDSSYTYIERPCFYTGAQIEHRLVFIELNIVLKMFVNSLLEIMTYK